MATRTINLSEESYARLRSLKKENESFSDVVNRITGKFLLLEIAGILDRGSTARLRKAKHDMDRRLRRSLRKASSGMA
jgi:predicted CopG family antitoxin